MANMTYEEKTEVWQLRMRELQGAIAVSAIFQVLIGLFGDLFTQNLQNDWNIKGKQDLFLTFILKVGAFHNASWTKLWARHSKQNTIRTLI